jgi:hypothetical protein
MLLSLFGRRYFSLFDFEFAELISNKKNKNTIFQNNISDVRYDMLMNPFSNKDNAKSILSQIPLQSNEDNNQDQTYFNKYVIALMKINTKIVKFAFT